MAVTLQENANMLKELQDNYKPRKGFKVPPKSHTVRVAGLIHRTITETSSDEVVILGLTKCVIGDLGTIGSEQARHSKISYLRSQKRWSADSRTTAYMHMSWATTNKQFWVPDISDHSNEACTYKTCSSPYLGR